MANINITTKNVGCGDVSGLDKDGMVKNSFCDDAQLSMFSAV